MIGFAVYSNITCLHDPIQIHIITLIFHINPSCLHNSCFIKIVLLSICVCKPACIGCTIYQKDPVTAGSCPDSFFCLRRNLVSCFLILVSRGILLCAAFCRSWSYGCFFLCVSGIFCTFSFCEICYFFSGLCTFVVFGIFCYEHSGAVLRMIPGRCCGRVCKKPSG